MKTIEKTLEYHELLMNLDDTSKYDSYELPDGFSYEFYKDGDINDWVNIHISSGEFMKESYGVKVFHDFYDSFLDELSKRCFFVISDKGEKVGTATISKLEESECGYADVVDWFAIKKEYQGYHLSKPMINRFIKLANDLGYNKILLHTQTHTWLAAKLYLDLGFEPFNINEDIKGWEILKTITNHPKLESINAITKEDMYFDIALKVVSELDIIYGKDNYEYSIWHKNGRHDVEVRYNNKVFDYKYYDEEIFRLEKENNYICKIANLDEMNIKWDYEIATANDDKDNWIKWKKDNIERFQKGFIIPYYGILNGTIICECTALLNDSIVQNADGLVGEKIAYLSAFRTNEEYQGQGYFSILFKYMIQDLKSRGYEKVTLGVEPEEEKNKAIYNKYGFTEHIKDAQEVYPDGTTVYVEYYGKSL